MVLNGINANTTFSGTKISISSVGDESLNSFTVSGTDLNDNVITEKIVGPLTNVRVEVAASMSDNGIIIESENGIIDGSIDAQFESLDKLFEKVGVDE